MEADLSRLPTGTAGWAALVRHASSLGDLAEVDWLELKGRLSFTERPERKHSAVLLSRAILGMANRSPDTARLHLGGYGVVLVGISKRTVVGAEEVDGAVLRQAIETYVGQDGPSWDHQFIRCPEGLVLALTIDPPQWGDRIHACRKDYSVNDGTLAVRDGDIFVRVPGKTQPAKSHDLLQLEMRLARAPHSGAEVCLQYDETFDRIQSGSVVELIKCMVDTEVEELLADLPGKSESPLSFGPEFSALFTHASALGDTRSPEIFRSEVEDWKQEAERAIEKVATEYLRYHLSRGRWCLNNESDRYLEGVRVSIRLPVGTVALLDSDTEYCDHGGPFRVFQLLPDRPPKYGSLRHGALSQFSLAQYRRSGRVIGAAISRFQTEETSAGYVLTWNVGDLPSRGKVEDEERFAILTDGHQDEVIATWSLTARGIHHVFRGDLRIPCEQPHGQHLTWAAPLTWDD